MTHRVARSAPTILLIMALLLPSCPFLSAPPATAVEAHGSINVTLLGDSYSAGNGAGDYYGDDKGAYRSRNSWAHHYVDWLNEQNVSATLTNLAHSGSVTDDLLGADGRTGQIESMPADTDVAMFTIGGNDVGFADIVKQCFMLGMRDAATCKEKVDAASTGMSDVRQSTQNILQRIDDKLPDGAQVVLVGYPRLATDREYVLKNFWGTFSYNAGAGVRGLSDTSRQMQSDLVNDWNAAHPGLKVTYIDGVINAFDGHEPDPSVTAHNDYRWINEFLETRGRLGDDGKTTSSFSADASEFYHPNMIGHEQIARLIEDKVGVPVSAQADGEPNGNAGNAAAGAAAPAHSDVATGDVTRAMVAAASTTSTSAAGEPFAWIQGPYVARAGATLAIDARASHASSGEITQYEWDFDGDGIYEETSSGPLTEHTFNDLYGGAIGVRVAQADGRSAVGTTRVDITDDGDITPRAQDNCPDTYNYGQTDYDGDGLGDECDPDPGYPTEDKPGVCVIGENCPDDPAAPAPSPSAAPAPSTAASGESESPAGPSADPASGAPAPDAALVGPQAAASPTPSAWSASSAPSASPSSRGNLPSTGAGSPALPAIAALVVVCCGVALRARDRVLAR